MLPTTPMVYALGIAQIVSWGSLFYAIGVLGPAIGRDAGVSQMFLFGSFTAGLLISGALSPWVGRMIDAHGGRLVLSAGSVLAAVAMAALALAGGPVGVVLGWALAGAAMSACLYDPAFATLSQHAGAGYRKALTTLTIFGGFASTIFWPLSHLLMAAWGWRAAFAVYAALHLCICLPIHLFLVPRRLRLPHAEQAPAPAATPRGLAPLAIAFAAAGFVASVLAVHVVTLLTAKGLTAAQAISLAMLIGPAQVAGRIAEFGFAARMPAVVVGYVAFGCILAAVAAMIGVEGPGMIALFAVLVYGCGNGLFTIIRGAVPETLFGKAGLGANLGRLAQAALFSRALAPAAFSAMLAAGLTRDLALAALAAVMGFAFAAYWLAVRGPRGEPPRRPATGGRSP